MMEMGGGGLDAFKGGGGLSPYASFSLDRDKSNAVSTAPGEQFVGISFEVTNTSDRVKMPSSKARCRPTPTSSSLLPTIAVAVVTTAGALPRQGKNKQRTPNHG